MSRNGDDEGAERLRRMHEEGLLTDAEYAAAERQLGSDGSKTKETLTGDAAPHDAAVPDAHAPAGAGRSVSFMVGVAVAALAVGAGGTALVLSLTGDSEGQRALPAPTTAAGTEPETPSSLPEPTSTETKPSVEPPSDDAGTTRPETEAPPADADATSHILEVEDPARDTRLWMSGQEGDPALDDEPDVDITAVSARFEGDVLDVVMTLRGTVQHETDWRYSLQVREQPSSGRMYNFLLQHGEPRWYASGGEAESVESHCQGPSIGAVGSDSVRFTIPASCFGSLRRIWLEFLAANTGANVEWYDVAPDDTGSGEEALPIAAAPSARSSGEPPTGGNSVPAPTWVENRLADVGDGYRLAQDSWFPAATLNAVTGVHMGSATGRGMRAFFFVDGQGYIGTDTSEESERLQITWRDDTTVAVEYTLYEDDDPGCCPTAGSAVVRYRWNGERLRPLDPIPPRYGEGSPHR